MPTATDYRLTTSGTARALNKSEQTIREYDRKGLLRAIRTSGGQRLFSEAEVEALKRAQSGDQSGNG